MSKTTPAQFAAMTRYPYACECGDRDCDRKASLTREQFETFAARGPVLSRTCAFRATLGAIDDYKANRRTA